MPHLLRISCPDAPGLVHAVTGVLVRHGCNVVSNHEFVETEAEHFFMRTAFTGVDDAAAVEAEVRALLPERATVTLATDAPRPVVLLATKEAHCLGDLLLRYAYEGLPADIRAVVANHDTLRPLVEAFGLPFHYVPHEGLSRAEHERAVLAAIEPYDPAYLVLAKYMRILSPAFVARYKDRILNIHHSFLPAFIGARPYHQAHERGVKIIGATAHIVTDDLDTGPILAQGTRPVDHTYTAEAMAQAGRDVEKIVLARALRLLLDERVFLHGNRTVVLE
ncbi:MAG: formyltetrahydrofolate deformylase [Rhodothermales bacterium]|nr:formyltetrahydrofolate deformylase [Rhodothermales bacterium]MCA0267636.1 formyltetrahydrofolate deformylase [Bacteroidota bacterium]